MTAAEIGRALGGKKSGGWWLCRCPAHDDHNPSLGLRDGDKAVIVRCFARCTPAEVIAALRTRGLWRGGEPEDDKPRPSLQHQPERTSDHGELAMRIWAERRQLPESPGMAYFERERGLAVPHFALEALGFHPACPRGPERLPAVLALMRDAVTNQPKAVHRTFLKIEGDRVSKAGGQNKMALGPSAGCVVKLSPDDAALDGLGIGEGLETCLRVLGIGWSPIWATTSASLMRTCPVLAGIEALSIFGDADEVDAKGKRAGQDAAQACAARWAAAGQEVRIVLPREIGADFDDVLKVQQ